MRKSAVIFCRNDLESTTHLQTHKQYQSWFPSVMTTEYISEASSYPAPHKALQLPTIDMNTVLRCLISAVMDGDVASQLSFVGSSFGSVFSGLRSKFRVAVALPMLLLYR